MKILKTSLLVFGIVAMFIGAIWIGQGAGFFPYPSSSFMVNQTQWAHYGTELALAGLVLVVLSMRGTQKAEAEIEAEIESPAETPQPPADGGGSAA